MFRRKKPLVTLFTPEIGLMEDESVRPQPSHGFIPNDWKKMPKTSSKSPSHSILRQIRTAKSCPSFAHLFSAGFIIPAWADLGFTYNPNDDKWAWATGDDLSPYQIKMHTNAQFLDHMDYKHRGERAQLIFKLICPWLAKTRPGWSLLQVPLFYQNDRDWQVLMGIIDTDVNFELHQQIAYFGNGNEVVIKKGTPLVQYIPIQRTKLSMDIRFQTDEDARQFTSNRTRMHSKATGGYNLMPRVPKKE